MAHNLVGRVPLVEAEYEQYVEQQVNAKIHELVLASRAAKAAQQQAHVQPAPLMVEDDPGYSVVYYGA